jgi:hypothetical protein
MSKRASEHTPVISVIGLEGVLLPLFGDALTRVAV